MAESAVCGRTVNDPIRLFSATFARVAPNHQSPSSAAVTRSDPSVRQSRSRFIQKPKDV